MKFNILHLNSLGEFPVYLQKKLKSFGNYISNTEAGISENKALNLAKIADILIIAPSALKPVKASFINKLERTKHIALVTVGYDWIDISECSKRGITVSTPIGANSEAVAEHIFGLFVNLAKRISEFHQDIKEKGAYDFRKYTGIELYGKTLGIIGLGNVGHKVCRISKGFDMNVLAYDRSEKTTKDYKIVDLDTLLENSDFIAVCIPLTNETKDLIDKKDISKMKDDVIIANTAREEVVNKDAVLSAINSNKVAGYGIETAIMTPIERNDPYLKYPNIILNPHNAFNTRETAERVNNMVVDNVISFIKGEPKNLLDTKQ